MSVHANRSDWVSTTALSWRGIAQRFSFLFFMFFSVGLLVVGHNNPAALDHMRARMVDGLAPTLSLFSQPMALAESFTGRIASYRALLDENKRLRDENDSLVRWQNAALAMANENKELRSLLHYKAEPSLAYISARVIADTGSAYVRSLVVTAGHVDGVREGMAAMTGEGLVGRVVEVGDWTSRVLLITDMNSRIPVMITDTGDHAILSGDNEAQPKLLYLPQDADVKVGARVMTSGHGGIFPPNLPVGVVTSTDHGVVVVTPMAALGRINQIRLVDFNLAAGAVNPMAASVRADPSAHE